MAGKLKIKYCIWDVGGVIYPYTLKFVNEFMKSRTEDMAAFNENNGAVGFDYDAFMLGKVSLKRFAASCANTARLSFSRELTHRLIWLFATASANLGKRRAA